MPKMAPLAYIQKQMVGLGNFISEWKNLSDEDKATLKQWADDEQNELEKTNSAAA